LGLERLEDRLMLSASDPGFHIGTALGESSDIADEGTPYTVYFSYDRPPDLADITKFTVDWKDGTVEEIFDPHATSATHTYDKAFRFDSDLNFNTNTYFLDASVSFRDDTTWHSEPFPNVNSTFFVSINDLAFPVISGSSDVIEGDTYTLNLAHTDPGAEPPYGWIISWNSEVEETDPDSEVIEILTGDPSSVTHVYTDGLATHTILAAYLDATDTGPMGVPEIAGGFLANTIDVTVHDVAPTLAISGTADTDEAASYTLNLSSSDPGDDTISSWTINWGDTTEDVAGNPSSATHTYADGNANYTISATATDEDGTFAAENTVPVTVHNIAPALAISGAADTTEGASYALGLSSLDPGADAISSWMINWGDTTEVVAGNPSTATHTYADGDASYVISATATDEDGTYSASNTVAVAVHNVAPTLAISGAADTNEGASYALGLSSIDPGADTISSWTINWGDSVQIVSGNPASVSHAYADGEANYTISATATDGDGTYSAGNTVAVAVHNVAPAPALSGAANTNEGAVYTLGLASVDPGADTISSWSINWGDSTQVVTGHPASVTHTYADGEASYTISATATDEDGTYSAGNTVAVAVHNVAPTLTLSGAANTNEAAVYTLGLSSSDPGVDTISGWTINWGDSTQVVTGHPASVTHTYADGNASYTISATPTDEDGTYSAGSTVAVAVHNVAPTLAISGAANTNEGAVYTLNLSSSDPGPDTISSWSINWGDTTQVVTGHPSSVTHTYADGDANRTISATATDEDGTYAAAATVAVFVHNVAPTLAISGAATTNEGAVYTLGLSSADPGADTISSWKINWGDGIQTVTGNPSSVTHTYADGANPFTGYTISATATDEDGTYSSANTVSVHVLNVAPTVNAGGPYSTFDDTSITLNGTSTDPAGGLDPLTYSWDLDNNGSFETSGASATFNPVTLGIHGAQTRTVGLRVSDGDSGVTTVSTTVQILGQGTTLASGVLYVVGSTSGSNGGSDVVTVSLSGSKVQVYSNVNNNSTLQFNSSDVHSIQITARGGNDVVTIASNVLAPVTIDGGAGDDVLVAGGGPSVIFGGTGNDVIVGGAGGNILSGGDGNDVVVGGTNRDLLIGGKGTDVIAGSAGDDILIGGYTTYDSNQTALQAVMAVWNSSASFSDRVASLTGTGGLLRSGVTVLDDDAQDVLSGDDGRDLYFADNNNHDGVVDVVGLQAALDALIAVT
jgi:PKD domain/RTX calcium-binding nonapeptide repeat (4 copies)